MGEAHVFITDDTLRQELHRTIDSLLAQRDVLRGALEVERTEVLESLRRITCCEMTKCGPTCGVEIAWPLIRKLEQRQATLKEAG